MRKEDIDLVRLALSVYHTRTVYPGCVEAFERIIQEKEMPTPMTIEMEADEIQAALDAFVGFDRTYDNRETFQLSEKTINTIRAALQSPRVPVIPGLDDAIASCVRYPKTNEIGFLAPADRDNVLKAARAYAELQKGV